MNKRRWWRVTGIFGLSLSLFFLFNVLGALIARAAQVKYIYDDLGRLYQVIDPQGNFATYHYDAVGNLLFITRSTIGGGDAPIVSGITPNSGIRGNAVQVIISGNHLFNSEVKTDNPGILINTTISSDTALFAVFSIAANAELGLTTVTVSNTFGSATINFIAKDWWVLSVEPPVGKQGVDTGTNVRLTLDRAVDPATVNLGTFGLSSESMGFDGQISFSGGNTDVTFTPTQPLPVNSVITVTLAAVIKDTVGNVMPLPFTSTFITSAVSAGPKLTVSYPGPTTLHTGDSVNIQVANIGSGNTQMAYLVRLTDMKGISLYQESIDDSINAGSSKAYSFQIPAQATNGSYILYAEVTDGGGTKTWVSYGLIIVGLNANLTTKTDKDVYNNTEAVTATTSIMSGSLALPESRLKTAVSKPDSSYTAGFKPFLPQQAPPVFDSPAGIAIGPDGSVYVVDTWFYRIQKFDSNGNSVLKWGGYGIGDGEFRFTWGSGMAVGSDGSVYVADTGNHRIQKFDSKGSFTAKWGSHGYGNGQFDNPLGVVAGPDGFVYVADTWNARVQKFGSNGNFIAQWGSYGSGDGQFKSPSGIAGSADGFIFVTDTDNNRVQKFSSNGNFVTRWGSYGSGNGQFYSPHGISIDPNGFVYVADRNNHRIQKFDGNGSFINKWGNGGNGNGQFDSPYGIAVGNSGLVYVADTDNNRVQKFNGFGGFIAAWGGDGSGDGQFNTPYSVAVSSDGSIFVLDQSNNRVQKFDANGNFVTQWGSRGSGNGEFSSPSGIAIGPESYLYVIDTGNHRVQKFDGNGNFVLKWGGYGSENGHFAAPTGIVIGSDGSVYVADSGNHRIQKFDKDDNFILEWGTWGSNRGQFYRPQGVAVGPDGYIYVIDWNYHIQKFDSNGNFINWFGVLYYPFGIAAGPDGSIFATEPDKHSISQFDSNGNFVTQWKAFGSGDGQFNEPHGITVGHDGSIYVADTWNQRIQRMLGSSQALFQTTIPINQSANTKQDYPTTIGTLNATGRLSLRATLLNSLGQDMASATYSFYVGTVLRVASANPSSGAVNVPINTPITVQFSARVDRTTITAASFSMVEAGSGTSISGNFSYDFNDTVIIFTPTDNLKSNTGYTINLTTAIKSTDGMALDGAFSSSFTTGGPADTVSPTVTVSPANGTTQVPINTLILFAFSEPINPVTINATTITVMDNGASVSGSIALNPANTVATFAPSSNFLPSSSVSVTLSRRVTDLAGNGIVGSSGVGTDFISSFTTASAADTTPPQVLSVNPPNGAIGVDPDTSISVTFSEPVNPLTVDGQRFSLFVGGTQTPGQIAFSGHNTIITFTPDHPFPTQSVVNVTLAAGISDNSGNGMPLPFISSFTTYQGGPALAIAYSEATTRTVGETIHIAVVNTGDGDTTSALTMKLTDSKGLIIYQNTINDTIPAGGSKTYGFQIPSQAADGDYLLDAEVIDNKGKKTGASFILKIIGLTATLNAKTDKETYLPTESVTGISTIRNGPFGIEGGRLKVSVSGIGLSTGGGVKHFLPKNWIWHPFWAPTGIAIGPDGSVYVVNACWGPSVGHGDCEKPQIQKFDGSGNFITQWGDSGSGDGQFDWPSYVAVDSNGFVYVTDSANDRIQKFDVNGTFIGKWGSSGSGDGQFSWPSGITVGTDGSVYVSDKNNNRIQKFDRDGNFVTKWGSQGWEEGKFEWPSGIAVDSENYLYVADSGNSRIQKFDSSGNFIVTWMTGSWIDIGNGNSEFLYYTPNDLTVGPDGSIYVTASYMPRPDINGNITGNPDNFVIKLDSSGNFVAKWGSQGSGYDEFNGPTGIAIGSNGSILVADTDNSRIQVLDSDGFVMTTAWGVGSDRDGEFRFPEGIGIGSGGSIFVAEAWNHRIQKFDSGGNFIGKWGSSGTGDGQFEGPGGIAVRSDGSVYVADTRSIQKFDSNGNFIMKWGSYGSGDGQFDSPQGVAIGIDGMVYVADTYNHRIQKFDGTGTLLTKWGSNGSGDGQFDHPHGIAVGVDGSVYVTDQLNHRIQKFDSNGTFVGKWGSEGTGDGQFRWPQGIAIGVDGSVYVSDTSNQRIQKFSSNGGFIARWGSGGHGDGQFQLPSGIAVGPDGTVYVVDYFNHRIQRMIGEDAIQTVFETVLPIHQAANSSQDYSTNIGILGVPGKYYFGGTLTNSLGQLPAQANYAFYLFAGDIALFLDADKRVYAPGDPVTISGRVQNRGTTDMTNLVLTLDSNYLSQSSQLLYTETFNPPAGGSHPFTVTTSAGASGTVILTGVVTQGNSPLVRNKDWYEVANP